MIAIIRKFPLHRLLTWKSFLLSYKAYYDLRQGTRDSHFYQEILDLYKTLSERKEITDKGRRTLLEV